MNGELVQDRFKDWFWKTAEGELIRVSNIEDAHLRNIALFLMGMGYRKCTVDDRQKIMWLTVLRVEWERRQANHSMKKWRADTRDMVNATEGDKWRE